MNAEEFNAVHSVGTPVFAYPGARPEDFPSDPRLVTRTRSRASVLGGHTDVVWVDGHSACIALSHVDVVSEDEYKAARADETATAVAGNGALPMPAKTEPGLSAERLTEIKNLLRYETSISFHSARAKESMLLLVAEVERQAAELAAIRKERDESTPLTIRWDRTVIHPEPAEDGDDETIVCCLTENGHPVALFLDDEYREALGLVLVDPDGGEGE